MEPISILAGTLGAKFLEEGIKFLWSEASKIIERYNKKAEPEVTEPAPEPLALPARRTIDFEAVARLHDDFRAPLRHLTSYATGLDPILATDAELLEQADALQRLVVQAYGIDAPELQARARVKVGAVKATGKVLGQKLTNVSGGTYEADVQAGDVEGSVTGQEIDNS